jgi:hypothetical protein
MSEEERNKNGLIIDTIWNKMLDDSDKKNMIIKDTTILVSHLPFIPPQPEIPTEPEEIIEEPE